MRRKLTTLRAKQGHSQNGSPRQLVDEALYLSRQQARNHANFPLSQAVWDTEYDGWNNASRPRDQAISLRRPVIVNPN